MKRLASTLSKWSRREFGDIFTVVKEYEEQVRQAEELHHCNAKYIKYLKLESSILKQKTQLQWFKDGDANSKYFHSIMRGRRRRLFIHKISTDDNEWIQGDENIAKAACVYFQETFTGHENRIAENILQCIPRMVTEEQNQNLQALPTREELKQAVYSMNPNSAPGPDGFGGMFYQAC
ncbi:hypothetical protein KY290_036526 [Solanum tuberosum]|uniref:RNA-directed DNA polymerase (Reverse transcriptase) n=1 Tax=Solanum tuberosum TaxID=4113 RepID=A0ABQ7TUJ4_SOLTU|nr:hypothetical protein KY289_022204 [Solanum tuberosum]KAH0737821.1 hypothetical protein KY290_036526 [Solanum tuberosum]